MNLLLTGAFSWTQEEITEIKSLGHKVAFLQQEAEALPCEYEWVEGIIGNGIFLYHSIEKFTSLKYIQLTSAGFDRVPMDYIKANNIEIHNARGVYSIPMAEFAVSSVLQLYKQSRFFLKNQRAHKWEKNRNLAELFEKTVCIVGCGSVGNECAKRFSAFGCNVIGVDLEPYENSIYSKMLSINELNCALEISDIIILTLPLNEQTHRLIDKKQFSSMKQGSVLVNIARGGIVNTEALTQALKTRLGGAVLDVFEEEPISENSPLWDMENVIITPHNSFVGEGNRERMLNIILKNLRGRK